MSQRHGTVSESWHMRTLGDSVLDSFCVDISVSKNSTVCSLCNKKQITKNLKDLRTKKSLEVNMKTHSKKIKPEGMSRIWVNLVCQLIYKNIFQWSCTEERSKSDSMAFKINYLEKTK